MESLYIERKDMRNLFLIGSCILGCRIVTDESNDYIFTDCEYYKLEWTEELEARIRANKRNKRSNGGKEFGNESIKNFEKRLNCVIFILICDIHQPT